MRIVTVSLPRLPRLHLVDFVHTALAIHRQRKQLGTLDAVQLADIGLTADQAIAESRRPIWDAPPHWRL